jgi:hypothetical protein
VACFASASPALCEAQAANLNALNHDAVVLLFVGGGERELLPGFVPGGARQLLVHASDAGPLASAALNLSVSYPVVDDGGRRLGFVVLEQSVPQLQELFDALPLPGDAAYAELQQSRPC